MRSLLVPAALAALGLTGCAARAEPPPDPDSVAEREAEPDIRADEPADPNASVEPPGGPGTGAEQPANPVVRPPTRTAQQPECISNTDVMNLVAAGAEDAAIIARLTTSETCFDVSSAAMLDLRNAGVRPRVIQAMVRAARREEH